METVPIRLDNITKCFRTGWPRKHTFAALRDVTFSVNQGEVFSMIGPNGAGKTTLVRLLLGFIRSDSGEAEVMNKPVRDASVRAFIGYLPENVGCPPYLTPRQFLTAWGCFGGLSFGNAKRQAGVVLDRVSLCDRGNSRIGEFSKGMMLRLGLAQALIANPDILILDEPTDGLDAEGRILFRSLLTDLRSSGKTILMNSHLLSEVERISDRIGILRKGELVKVDKLENLIERSQQYVVTFQTQSTQLLEELRQSFALQQRDDRWSVRTGSANGLEQFLGKLRNANATILSIDQDKKSLEDAFLSIAVGK